MKQNRWKKKLKRNQTKWEHRTHIQRKVKFISKISLNLYRNLRKGWQMNIWIQKTPNRHKDYYQRIFPKNLLQLSNKIKQRWKNINKKLNRSLWRSFKRSGQWVNKLAHPWEILNLLVSNSSKINPHKGIHQFLKFLNNI